MGHSHRLQWVFALFIIAAYSVSSHAFIIKDFLGPDSGSKRIKRHKRNKQQEGDWHAPTARQGRIYQNQEEQPDHGSQGSHYNNHSQQNNNGNYQNSNYENQPNTNNGSSQNQYNGYQPNINNNTNLNSGQPNDPNGTNGLSAVKQEFMNWLNSERARRGLGQLKWSDDLDRDARQNNVLQNSRGLGHHHMPRARDGMAVQNSSMGGPSTMASQWMNSSPHRANLLSPSINAMAVDCLGQYCTFNGAFIR